MIQKRPGGRRARRSSGAAALQHPVVQLTALALGALLTGLAWVYLVGAAIDFGVLAVRGEVAAWVFTFGASAGAVVCLVLMLAVIARSLRMLGFLNDYRPRRAAPRRRR